MDDWIDYYDSAHTIYASRRHRDVHFRVIAEDIIRYIPSPAATVLDYACGEALEADKVAAACAHLILAEPAPGVRARLEARYAGHDKITVTSPDALRKLPRASGDRASVDLTVMNSVAQYMTPAEFDGALGSIRGLLKQSGSLVVGDVIPADAGMAHDVLALLRFAARHGFLMDALAGLARTAFSDYRQLRNRVGLQRYSEGDLLGKLRTAGFEPLLAAENLGHNPWRMTFVAKPVGRHG